MIAVLQRVKKAAVKVDGETVGECKAGLCILLGVAKDDGKEDADALAEKIVNLRIFTDENDLFPACPFSACKGAAQRSIHSRFRSWDACSGRRRSEAKYGYGRRPRPHRT